MEPNYSNEHPSNIIALRLALGEAQQRGELINQTHSYRHTYHNKWGREQGFFVATTTHYSRHDLRRYAERKGQRPLFLFPEDRTAQLPVETANTVRREQGKQGTSLQHAERNKWYAEAVERACALWKKGSTLRHDQMANDLIKDSPSEISRNTLLSKLKDALTKMGNEHLIRGFNKK